VRVAALDLGSNSFHLLVADVSSAGLEPVVRAKEMLRLGSIVAAHGRLGDSAIEQATRAATGLLEVARHHGAERVAVCGTDALRRAPDGPRLARAVGAAAGVEVHILTGDEEAALIFEAVRARMGLGDGQVLAADLGGGSLELMVGGRAGLKWSVSLPLGVARLTAELVRDDPPSAADVHRLRTVTADRLRPQVQHIGQLSPVGAVGTSGTLLTLIGLAHAERGTPPARWPARAGLDDLRLVEDRLLRLDHAGRQALPGVEARRADLLPAGAVCCVTLLECTGLGSLAACDWALREGMLLAEGARPAVPRD
jgi:exopolyphosphatase/guanosine-5'-triphosphate,3'-diphosphate pyrophosphatase